MKQAGHVVLITGGATGIGLALAHRFHAAGNQLILVGRSQSKLNSASAELPGARTVVADVSVPADCERLAADHPEVTILVNNAGIQNIARFIETSSAEITQEVSTDFLGPALLCRAFLPFLSKRESAAIVNVSSGLALVPKESAVIYCASKAALHSFTKTLRWQLEPTGVKVFEILPPVVDTAMTTGRGRAKITPAQLADEFWSGFQRDRFEMRIGLTKVFAFAHRIAPSLVEKLVRKGE